MNTFAVIMLVAILIATTTINTKFWDAGIKVYKEEKDSQHSGVIIGLIIINLTYSAIILIVIKYIILWGYPLFHQINS